MSVNCANLYTGNAGVDIAQNYICIPVTAMPVMLKTLHRLFHMYLIISVEILKARWALRREFCLIVTKAECGQ